MACAVLGGQDVSGASGLDAAISALGRRLAAARVRRGNEGEAACDSKGGEQLESANIHSSGGIDEVGAQCDAETRWLLSMAMAAK